jgi:hypothetical protein
MKFIEERFGHLVGLEVKNKDETKTFIATPELIESALSKCISDKRSMKGTPNKKMSDEDIVDSYIHDADILSRIPSVVNLCKGNPNLNKKEVKIDEIRKMDLGLDKFAGYEPNEISFIQDRLKIYKEFYEVNAPNDEFQVFDIIDMELEMIQLKTFIKLNPKKCDDEKKQLKELRVQYSKAQQDLNVKKQQRDSVKGKSNTDNETDLFSLIKSVDEMQAEVEEENKEIQHRMKEKAKRK